MGKEHVSYEEGARTELLSIIFPFPHSISGELHFSDRERRGVTVDEISFMFYFWGL